MIEGVMTSSSLTAPGGGAKAAGNSRAETSNSTSGSNRSGNALADPKPAATSEEQRFGSDSKEETTAAAPFEFDAAQTTFDALSAEKAYMDAQMMVASAEVVEQVRLNLLA